MDLTSSNTECVSDSGSDSNEYDEVFSKNSHFDLINFCQDLMDRCQENTKHMKVMRKHYDLLKY